MLSILRKASVVWLATVVVALAFPVHSLAALFDRGNGMIYDSEIDVLWLSDGNLALTNNFGVLGITTAGSMEWTTAKNWIAALNAAHYKGYADWRLPFTTQPDPSCSGQVGIVSYGYQCSGGELGHLFYQVFGGTPGSTIGTGNPSIEPITNIGTSYIYWSATEYYPGANIAWGFFFSGGFQYIYPAENFGYAWAVRDGDVAVVPEPPILVLVLLACSLYALRVVRPTLPFFDARLR